MKCKTIIIIACFVIGMSMSSQASERKKYNFNSDWLVAVGDVPDGERPATDDSGWKRVTLPHAFNEDEAFKLSIEQLADTVSWYRKHFSVPQLNGRKVFVEFEGIRQGGDFYLNGHRLGLHENGIMAVGYDLTPYITEGDNVIAVRIDNDWAYRERHSNATFQWNDKNFNANYGGIPKNVWLHVTPAVYQTLPLYSSLNTTGVYVYASDFDIKGREADIHAESEVRNESDSPATLSYRVTLRDADGRKVKTFSGDRITLAPGETGVVKASERVGGLNFWSWGYGYLYDVDTELMDDKGRSIDKVQTRTGFRKTRFGDGKIWLNDRMIQIH
ncbi:MAG: beta-galactosidase, partial [Duncaniella sp.]|nr:beta-galactosidase [Duncaniella sp.]